MNKKQSNPAPFSIGDKKLMIERSTLFAQNNMYLVARGYINMQSKDKKNV